jgi:uncharacterized protein (TIGR03435 family)
MTPHQGTNIDGARVDIGSATLLQLIITAYALKPYQVSGPDWMNSARFDILAKMPDGATKGQVPEMLQSLLAERFKLTAHRSAKEQPVYALVVGKNGPNLKESLPDPQAPAVAGAQQEFSVRGNLGNNAVGISIVRRSNGGTTKVSVANSMLHIESSKQTLQELADGLVSFLGRPVLDMTGLKGTYQVSLDITVADSIAASRVALADSRNSSTNAASDPPGGSSIFVAVEKLGLKLEPRRSSVEQLIIDHIDRTPTEN